MRHSIPHCQKLKLSHCGFRPQACLVHFTAPRMSKVARLQRQMASIVIYIPKAFNFIQCFSQTPAKICQVSNAVCQRSQGFPSEPLYNGGSPGCTSLQAVWKFGCTSITFNRGFNLQLIQPTVYPTCSSTMCEYHTLENWQMAVSDPSSDSNYFSPLSFYMFIFPWLATVGPAISCIVTLIYNWLIISWLSLVSKRMRRSLRNLLLCCDVRRKERILHTTEGATSLFTG